MDNNDASPIKDDSSSVEGSSQTITPVTSLNLSPIMNKSESQYIKEESPTRSQGTNAQTQDSHVEPDRVDQACDEEDEHSRSASPESQEEDESVGYGSEGSSISLMYHRLATARGPRKAIIQKRYAQHAQHLQLTEDRIRDLEIKMREALKEVDESSVSTEEPEPEKVPAIPELNFVDWATFKATTRATDYEARHAIDVLVGEPVLFHQRHKTLHTTDGEPQVAATEAENLPLNTIPDRIRINSIPLHAILKNILGRLLHNVTRPMVILRPYKPLLCHEADLRQALEALEMKWTVSSDQLAAEDVSKEDGTDEEQNDNGNPGTRLEHRDSTTSTASTRDVEEKAEDGPIEPHASPEAMSELRCLLRFLEAIKPLMGKVRQTPSLSSPSGKPERATVLFRDLWYLFEPGQYVYNRSGVQKLWRVIQTTGGRHYLSSEDYNNPVDGLHVKKVSDFVIDCYYLDFDGKEFGPVKHQFSIRSFNGAKHVTDLDVYPIEHLPNHDSILGHLSRRGAEFAHVTGVAHKFLKGRTLVKTPKGSKIATASSETNNTHWTYPEDVEGPVIVDFDRTLQFNPTWAPEFGISDLAEQDEAETREMTMGVDATHPPDPYMRSGRPAYQETCSRVGCCQNEYIVADFLWDRQRTDEFISGDPVLSSRGFDKDIKVPSAQQVLFPNRVFGFVLRNRKWACLPLDCLKDVPKDRKNFDALELAGKHKEIVIGLVDTHFKTKEKEKRSDSEMGPEDPGFDLVRAKGKGLIVLLHGAPGVGKTSTAECVAEAHGKPLFPITCGDLGVNPIEVEKGLDFNFQLAESWGCVLLLDEADVFLAQRAENDLSRNALVSIFLRALEYYSGILFLTTNRVGSIDEAFRSRIHMSLFYPILSPTQTEKIWRAQLGRAKDRDPKLIMNVEDVIRYAMNLFKKQMEKRKVGWNGRQIRNAMKTAISLAEYDSLVRSQELQTEVTPNLEIRWFEVVAQASWEFDEYLERALDMSALMYAKLKGLRDDKVRYNEGGPALPSMAPGTWQPWQGIPEQPVPQQQQYATTQPGLYVNYSDTQQQTSLFGTSATSTAPVQHYQSMQPQYASQQNHPQAAQLAPSQGYSNSIPTTNTMPIPVQPTGMPQGSPGMPPAGQGSHPGMFQHSQLQGHQPLYGQYQQSYGNQNLQAGAYGMNQGGPPSSQPGSASFPGYGNPGGAPAPSPQHNQTQPSTQ